MTSVEQPCSCCVPRTEPVRPAAEVCPGCGVPSAWRVQAVTLRALLKGTEQGRVAMPEYRICMSQDCPVVYFDPADGALFTKEQVSVRVGFKERDDPRPLCYCFDHSWGSLRKEWSASGQSTALAAIRDSIRASGCRCEETNPLGVCCLPDVVKALQLIQG